MRFLPAPRPRTRVIIAAGDDVRSFTIRPRLAIGVAIATALFGILYFTATGYLIFRDDLLAASLARQARLQQAYEDRIAALRADIDRLTSRQLLNQEAYEAKLERLLGRQAALDARQDILAGLSQAARGAGIAPEPADAATKAEALPPADAEPLVTGSLDAAGSRAPLAAAVLRNDTSRPPPQSDALEEIGTVEASLDQLARDQVAYVEAMADKVADRADRIAGVIGKLGHKLPETAGDGEAVGGPFVPLDDNADPETFRSTVSAVALQIDRLAALRAAARKLPLLKPIPNAAITSRFGTRLDPFLRRPALHTGIDFKAPSGYPVKATAAGTVIAAEYAGGYGYMVEIDHGKGVTTRYGHLSRMLVKPGAVIETGALIGRAGSTGRSTGPHLHYEIRIGGRPIDPMRYLRAATELASVL